MDIIAENSWPDPLRCSLLTIREQLITLRSSLSDFTLSGLLGAAHPHPKMPTIPPCPARGILTNNSSGLRTASASCLQPRNELGWKSIWKDNTSNLMTLWLGFVFLEGISSQIMFERPNRQGIDELLGKANIWCLLCSIYLVISHSAIKAQENLASSSRHDIWGDQLQP